MKFAAAIAGMLVLVAALLTPGVFASLAFAQSNGGELSPDVVAQVIGAILAAVGAPTAFGSVVVALLAVVARYVASGRAADLVLRLGDREIGFYLRDLTPDGELAPARHAAPGPMPGPRAVSDD